MDPITEGNFYHIYNRGAGKGNIFMDPQDFTEFIQKYYYYLYPSVQTFAWCLLSNHFHALVRIRTHNEQASLYKQTPKLSSLMYSMADQIQWINPLMPQDN